MYPLKNGTASATENLYVGSECNQQTQEIKADRQTDGGAQRDNEVTFFCRITINSCRALAEHLADPSRVFLQHGKGGA